MDSRVDKLLRIISIGKSSSSTSSTDTEATPYICYSHIQDFDCWQIHVTDGEKKWFLCVLEEQDLPKPAARNMEVFLKAWADGDLKLSELSDGSNGLKLTACDFENSFVLNFDLLPSPAEEISERVRWLLFQITKNHRSISTAVAGQSSADVSQALTLSLSNSPAKSATEDGTVEDELKFLRDEVERLKRRLAFERAGNQALLPSMTFQSLKQKVAGPKLKVKQNSSLLNPTSRKRPALGPRFKDTD